MVRLILIQTNANLGYAGGNNVGLRYCLARDDFAYVWLLNNDTVVKEDALSFMVRRMKERPDAGICGSTLPFYGKPDTLWALGGATYNKWLARPSCIGLNRSASNRINSIAVEQRMKYVAGASMLVSGSFLRNIGLMNEDYFLFFEELDWAVRAKGRYSLVYAPESIVYHKVGGSTKKRKEDKIDRRLEQYFMFRNSILFTFRHFAVALPLVAPFVTVSYLMKRLKSSITKLLRYF
jgi:hypothetical protein